MAFDLSRIVIFQAGDWSGTAPNQVFTKDNSATYAMIDAAILAAALAGLTLTQQTLVGSYQYVPTASDYASRGFPTWAGASPPPVYFKVTGIKLNQQTQLQSALAKYYK
jgi:hypothetical protein